ncbi:MAG: hypothetical protein KDA68_20355, partial [Planctomycetaceae bacterium]|nr:hypothetical protein [Planctomycetaceae bacterium]
YTDHSIKYDFHQSVIIVEYHKKGAPTVNVKHSKNLSLMSMVKMPRSGKNAVNGTRSAMKTAGSHIANAGATLGRPFTKTVKALPLTRTEEDFAIRKQANAVERAARERDALNRSIETLR